MASDANSRLKRDMRRGAAGRTLRWVAIVAGAAAAALVWRLLVEPSGDSSEALRWTTGACAAVAASTSILAEVIRRQLSDTHERAAETEREISDLRQRLDQARQQASTSAARQASSTTALAATLTPDPARGDPPAPQLTVCFPRWLVVKPDAATWLTDDAFVELRRAIAYVAEVGRVTLTPRYEARRRQWDEAGSVMVVFRDSGDMPQHVSHTPVPVDYTELESSELVPVDWHRFREAIVRMLEGRLASVRDEGGWMVRQQPEDGPATAEVWRAH